MPTFPVPPVFPSIDKNGVDLTTGRFTVSARQAWIGPEGQGLARTYLGYGARDSLAGTISSRWIDFGVGTQFTVSFGGSSTNFIQPDGGSNFVPKEGSEGTTLTYNSATKTHTFTGRDGTVAVFVDSRIRTITRPNREVVTYHYDIADPDPSCANTCHRLKAVTSSLGYMMKYDYAGDTFMTYSTTLVKVTGINLVHEYCDPLASSCSLSQPGQSSTIMRSAPGVTPITETVIDAMSRSTTYTIDGSNTAKITKIQKPGGAVIDITYDSSGRVQTVTNGVGTWTYAFTHVPNAAGTRVNLQATITDPLGHTQVVATDSSGRIVSTTDGVGQTTQYEIDYNTGAILRVTRPEGDYTAYTYDARGNLTSVTEVAKPGSGLPNRVTTIGYSATCTNIKICNKPNYVISGGQQTDYTWDTTHGQLLTVTSPAGANGIRPQTRYSYTAQSARYRMDASGTMGTPPLSVYVLTGISTCMTQASCVDTADESRVRLIYGDSVTPRNLQVFNVTKQSGDGSIIERTAYAYNRFGDLRTFDGPMPGSNDIVRNRFNDARELVGRIEVDPDGEGTGRPAAATRYSYNADGQLQTVENGSVVSQSDADWLNFTVADQQVRNYDAIGRLAKTSLIGGGATLAVTQYSYDNANRLECAAVRMNPAAFGSLPSSACVLGASGASGADRITRNTYTNADQLQQTTVSYATAESRNGGTLTYSPNGKVATMVDGNGNRTTYEYDGFDRVAKIRFPTAALGSVSSTTDYAGYTYDAVTGNVIQERLRDGGTINYAYDNLGRATQKAGVVPTVDYAYDNLGLQRSATFAAGGQSVAAVYDAFGRVVSVTDALGTVGYQYDAGGNRSRLTWADGFYVTYSYDRASNLLSIRENGSGALATFTYDNLGRRSALSRLNGTSTTYTYDAASRLASLTQDLAGAASDQTLTFNYNPASQIISRSGTNAAYAWSVPYAEDRAYGVNGLNQIASAGGVGFAHDGRGNMTSDGVRSYTFDADNKLTSQVGGATLAYRPTGDLAQLTSATGVVTQFAYDGGDIIAEYNGSGVLQRRYVHGPGFDEPLVWYEGAGTTNRSWLMADHQGSIIAISNGSGAASNINTYDEYGVPGPGNSGRFQYTGQNFMSELGLYHYKARAYSHSLGRFLQADPIQYSDGPNMYAYVGNDPFNRVDPFGLAGLFPRIQSIDAGTLVSPIDVPGGARPVVTGERADMSVSQAQLYTKYDGNTRVGGVNEGGAKATPDCGLNVKVSPTPLQDGLAQFAQSTEVLKSVFELAEALSPPGTTVVSKHISPLGWGVTAAETIVSHGNQMRAGMHPSVATAWQFGKVGTQVAGGLAGGAWGARFSKSPVGAIIGSLGGAIAADVSGLAEAGGRSAAEQRCRAIGGR